MGVVHIVVIGGLQVKFSICLCNSLLISHIWCQVQLKYIMFATRLPGVDFCKQMVTMPRTHDQKYSKPSETLILGLNSLKTPDPVGTFERVLKHKSTFGMNFINSYCHKAL